MTPTTPCPLKLDHCSSSSITIRISKKWYLYWWTYINLAYGSQIRGNIQSICIPRASSKQKKKVLLWHVSNEHGGFNNLHILFIGALKLCDQHQSFSLHFAIQFGILFLILLLSWITYIRVNLKQCIFYPSKIYSYSSKLYHIKLIYLLLYLAFHVHVYVNFNHHCSTKLIHIWPWTVKSVLFYTFVKLSYN